MITCSKTYSDIPFAHRQHRHKGHCSLIHGHNWAFKFTFGARELDENGFVIDFGNLKWLKEWIDNTFDHKLVLNSNDPLLGILRLALEPKKLPHTKGDHTQLASITTVPNCGAERLAEFLLESVNEMLSKHTKDRVQGPVYCVEVEVFEDSKNSGKATSEEFFIQ